MADVKEKKAYVVEEIEKEAYIKWGVLPIKGSAKRMKTGTWRTDRYPVFKPWKCQACPPGREKCPDATLDCPFSCQRACLLCFVSCPDDCIKLENGVIFTIDMDYCKGCGICAKVCSRGAIEMRPIEMRPIE